MAWQMKVRWGLQMVEQIERQHLMETLTVRVVQTEVQMALNRILQMASQRVQRLALRSGLRMEIWREQR